MIMQVTHQLSLTVKVVDFKRLKITCFAYSIYCCVVNMIFNYVYVSLCSGTNYKYFEMKTTFGNNFIC